MTRDGNPANDTLFMFIVESGNFDFSERGTRHFVMAGVIALAPLGTVNELQALRYRLLAQGQDIRQFHASEDRQAVRDEVFDIMPRLSDVNVHVVFGTKMNAGADLRNDAAFHALFGGSLVQFAVDSHAASEYRQIVVVFDQALTKSKQGVFHAAVKQQLKALGKPFHLYFQPMIADMNGQLADYVSWSKFVQLERGEGRPWAAVRQSLTVTEQELLPGSTHG